MHTDLLPVKEFIVYKGSGTTVAGKIYYYKSDGSWGLTDPNAASTGTGWLAVALGTDPDNDGNVNSRDGNINR